VISNYNDTTGSVDYDSGPYTVMFTAGWTSALCNIPIIDDNLFETNESFSLTIIQGSLPTGVSRGSHNQVTVVILDNDGEQLYNQLLFLYVIPTYLYR